MSERKSVIHKLLSNSTVDKNKKILELCKNKSVLDLGCIRHSADFALKDPNWLHKQIIEVAESVVGIDYLEEEILKLKTHGYNIVYGDVTKKLPLDSEFDVIVAGDLIEHLSNFDGFIENVIRLLKNDGCLVITTPNPFYLEEFFYAVMKNDVFVNPEHTCWIDPVTLNQLISRFQLYIDEMYFIDHTSWKLKYYILNSKRHEYDTLNGCWHNNTMVGRIERKFVEILFGVIYGPIKYILSMKSKLIRYADYMAIIKRR